MVIIESELCFICYGDGKGGRYDDKCDECNGTGRIDHGPWHECRFCKEKICGCNSCQAYCNCSGYYEYYIIPYEEEMKEDSN